jgi:hypothetical protein
MTDSLKAVKQEILETYQKQLEALNAYFEQENHKPAYVIELESLFISPNVIQYGKIKWDVNPVNASNFPTREEAEKLAHKIRNGNGTPAKVLQLFEAAQQTKKKVERFVEYFSK